jgi:hypothetical protein
MADCPYAKSDMTPCVRRDGDVCWAFASDGQPICVGCERRPRQLGLPGPAVWPPQPERRPQGRRDG